MAAERVEDKRTADEPPVSSAPKRPYRAPTLACWGTLRDVTKAVGRSGKNDHGNPGHGNINKTGY